MNEKIDRRTLLKSCAVGASAGLTAQSKPNTFRLVRDIPIEQGYDLVVAGGGPAGAAAAICAARQGAKVLLAEATGCMGGMGTSGLVTAFDPMSDGKRTLVKGFMNEVVTTLYKRGFLGKRVTPEFWEASYMTWTPFNVEGYKPVLDEFAVAAGVEVRFFTRVIDADIAPNKATLNGVVLSNIEGYRYVKAKTFYLVPLEREPEVILMRRVFAERIGSETQDENQVVDRIPNRHQEDRPSAAYDAPLLYWNLGAGMA
jgi:hypothetical protein